MLLYNSFLHSTMFLESQGKNMALAFDRSLNRVLSKFEPILPLRLSTK